ncbi:hypothetical protein [Labedella gwakjiensis]|uniref:Peptidase inhibitor family I36 n=1 Tax=Labedella gwakjiensis TaxID=390269 RepID=A0ABY0CB52_9MICO|nr:hypothetical protein [Labedella gwakjiensis]RUQ87291.1 hypothetical protein ELQ93_10340 [Labedella gwakjiensis]
MKRMTAFFLAVVIGVAVPTTIAPTAHADDKQHTQQLWEATTLTNKLRLSTSARSAKPIATCSVGTDGGICTISRGKSADRTISLSLGLTRSVAASSLGFSSAKSVSTTVSCQSPVMKRGSVWRAWAVGHYWKYKAQKVTYVDGVLVNTQTSGYLYAFNPGASRIHCA